MNRIPVIYDVDTGLDDALALFAGVNDPRFDVLAITATYGNCKIEYAIQNTLNATKLLGRTDIPVAAGAAHGWKMPKHPAPYIHGEKGVGTYVYPYNNKENLVTIPAWDLIAQKCLESRERVTIFVLGPCTNVANALIKYPEIKKKIDKLIFMGGGLREGAAGQCASVNVYHDPEAFRYLVRSGVDFHMCTSEQMTDHCSISPRQAREAFKGVNELCDVAYHLILDYHKNTAAFGESVDNEDGPVVLHDPACIMYALDPDKCDAIKVFCDIELSGKYSHGLTVIDINDRYGKPEKEKNIRLVCAREGYDSHFRQMFIDGIKNAGKR